MDIFPNMEILKMLDDETKDRIKLSFIDDNYLWKTVMALISQGHHHRTLQGKMTLSFRVTSSII